VTLAVTGNYYFWSGFSASEGAGVSEASTNADGSRWDIRWLIGRRTKPTLCVFPVFSGGYGKVL
jgi:hypothetical protein